MSSECKSLVLKPLLLADSTLEEMPQHVSELMATTLKQLVDANEDDILVVLIFVLMMETGFTPADSEIITGPDFNIRLLREVKSMPKNWFNKNRSAYTLKFKLCNLEKSPVILQINKIEYTNSLEVNMYIDKETMMDPPPMFTISGEWYVKIVYFNSSEFVADLGNPSVPMKFRKLAKLSNTFKKRLSVPMRSEIMATNGFGELNLESLPDELKLKIFKRLSRKDLLSLSGTCKLMRNVATDQGIWRNLAKLDFKEAYKSLALVGGKFDWPLYYKAQFLRKKYSLSCFTTFPSGGVSGCMPYVGSLRWKNLGTDLD